MSIYSKSLSILKKDKILFLSVILTFPSILIWGSGGVSYLWSFIYRYIIIKLPSSGQLFILLVIPFIALNSALLSYLKTKIPLSKKLFFLNLFFVILVIATSLLLGG